MSIFTRKNVDMDPREMYRRKAVRFARFMLISVTIASVMGNTTMVFRQDNWLPEQVAVAALAPLMLAATVHMLALMVQAGIDGWRYKGALAAVGIICCIAFALSFEKLAALAAAAGHSGHTTLLLPLLVDAVIGVATGVLVVLDRPAAGTVVAAMAEPVAVADTVAVEAAETSLTTENAPAKLHVAGAADAHMERARELVAGGWPKAEPAAVATALAGLAAGESQRAAAAASGLHRTTVGRLAEVATAGVAG